MRLRLVKLLTVKENRTFITFKIKNVNGLAIKKANKIRLFLFLIREKVIFKPPEPVAIHHPLTIIFQFDNIHAIARSSHGQ